MKATESTWRYGRVYSVSPILYTPGKKLGVLTATDQKIVIVFIVKLYHVIWVPCHHGMARPQVADGGKSSGYGG
jgi:hypothetical protein